MILGDVAEVDKPLGLLTALQIKIVALFYTLTSDNSLMRFY